MCGGGGSTAAAGRRRGAMAQLPPCCWPRQEAGGRAEGPPEEWRVFIARRALGQAGRGSLSEAREKRRDRWLEHLL